MSGTGFEEEPNVHRQGACEVNTFVDHDDHLRRKRPITDSGSLPLYPSTQREELFAVRYGDIVVRRKGKYTGETKLYATTSLCGAGADELSMFPNDLDMVKVALKAQYDIVGVACTEYNPEHDAPDQGFVTAIAGLHTVPIMTNQRFEPGQIVRAELPDDDPSFSTGAKMAPSGRSLASYPWRVVPEDYDTPGNLLLKHITVILEDQDRWRAVMSLSGSITPDKWLFNARAEGDGAIMTTLLGIYVLMKMGYLQARDPAAARTQDPYSDRVEMVRSGGIRDAETPHDFCVKMAELLEVQSHSVSRIPSVEDQNYFRSLRRRLLMTIFYSGKNRPFEFGQRDNNANVPTRDPKTGAIDMGSAAGVFLHNQINHVRRRVGANLQALDEHCSKRLGRVMSGPNRKKRININLERTFL